MILIGSVPGGTASNVITLLAHGNVPLSVTMTACSTLLSPLMTPLAMKLLAGTYVPIDAWAMMQSILTMIIAPLVVGLAIHHFLPAWAARCARWLPLVAMTAICLVIAITVAASREELLTVGLALFAACACHNATGYLLGFGIARAAGLESHRLPNRGHRGRHAKRRHGHRAGVRGSARVPPPHWPRRCSGRGAR